MRYREYWNNREIEQRKPFWIKDGSDTRIINYLRAETNLERCFRDALTFVGRELGGVRGNVVDVGAGVCWTSAILSQIPNVELVLSIDFSAHRLLELAPIVLKQYNAAEHKIERQLLELTDSFRPARSFHLAVFCQALYMHSRPTELLRNVYEFMECSGVVLVSCERIVANPPPWRKVRRQLESFWRHAIGRPIERSDLRKPDGSGKYPYLDKDYRQFIAEAGFELFVQRLDYPLFKQSSTLAVNYFGVKP